MLIDTLKNKKIGIWGLGIVGTSVLNYLQNITPYIQILDKKQHPNIPIIIQAPETIKTFLEYNDFIIPSPGISLLDYQSYAHKFICELDLFAQECTQKTIAITGTLGKTTVTSFLQQCIPNAIASGNIGTPMLDTLKNQSQHSVSVLELSSYQLQYTQFFAPNIAVWTNFYPNHLDHHANIEEYFAAKCMIFKHQKPEDIAIIPIELIDQIKKHTTIKSQIYLVSTNKPTTHVSYPIFYVHNNQYILDNGKQQIVLLEDIQQLPAITFIENWIIILAVLHIQKYELNNQVMYIKKLQNQSHRLEFVKKIGHMSVYNDSKSTIWQSTKHAIEQFGSQRIALLLGGMSKGTDRTPLIDYLTSKNIHVFTFGAETNQLSSMCQKYNVAYTTNITLEEAITKIMQQETYFEIMLLSPAGSSFDQFKNYEDRGTYFKNLINSFN